MQRLNSSSIGAVVICLFPALDAEAQLEFSTGEIYTCNYVNGSDYDDFRGAVSDWNRWMDQHDLTAYNGVALQPYYHSADLEAELVWLGGWTSGAAEGEHVTAWINDAEAVIEGFERVVTCPSHSRWVTAVLDPFDDPREAGSIGMAEFRNCWIKANRTLNDALGALGEWLEFEADFGIDTGHLLLLPVAGLESDSTFDFKWIIGFSSLAAHGTSADPMIQRGGAGRFNELIENVMTCDSPRVYATESARAAEVD